MMVDGIDLTLSCYELLCQVILLLKQQPAHSRIQFPVSVHDEASFGRLVQLWR
jgi:hypothetical protein